MNAMYRDLGLLLLRVGFGGLLLSVHGWGKLMAFSERMHTFSDPFGLGSPVMLTFAVFAEVFCAFAVAIGLFTRVAAIPVVITMFTASFVVHANDPFSKAQPSLMFGMVFMALVLVGGGRFSIDTVLEKLQLKRRAS